VGHRVFDLPHAATAAELRQRLGPLAQLTG
jgi:hypothetical protein